MQASTGKSLMMDVKTITTIGPSSIEAGVLSQLRDSKLVDSFRLNLSHLNLRSLEDHVMVFEKFNIKPA